MRIIAAIACLSVISLAALPEIRVSTQNNVAISSTSANRQGAGNCQSTNTFSHKYVAMQLTLTDPRESRNNITVSTYKDSIRGRGNSTWAVDKKPYRIKFDDNKSMFGSAKHRSWALLANWYDPTFTLNAVGFELGKRLGLPGTPGYYFVDLYINNAYKGLYQMTDLVQVNKGRVEVDEKEGWLVEFDYHCPSDADEIDFNTDYPNNPASAKLHSYIKSPEGLPNASSYQFVKDQVNALTNAMFKTTGFPTNGYRDLLDLESFAKYIMIEQFIDNFDFNNKADNSRMPASNYIHKDKGKKIVAGPLWDLDLAAGVEMTNFPKHYQTYQNAIRPQHPFHSKFFDDPVFLAKFKKAWDKHINDFRDMTKVMDSIATYLEGSVVNNFALQNGGGTPCTNPWGCGGSFGMTPNAPATVQAYKDEVGQLKTWWNNRITFFQQELNKMNIDTSKDIVEPSSSSLTQSSSSLASSSSSSTTSGGNTNCAYQASWCGNATPSNNSNAKPTTGQCVFVKDYTALTISGAGGTVLINGTPCTGSNANCTASKPSASDGGYYIYVQEGALSGSQPYTVTAGAPVCSGPTPIIVSRTDNILTLSNSPGTKVEVYSLQGKLVYSGYSGNSQILQIPVQTKGIYIVRYGKTQRLVVVK